MTIILALGRLRQEDGKFEASFGYVVRSYLQNKLTKNLFPAIKSYINVDI